MHIQARLLLTDELIPHYPDWSHELHARINSSIRAKVNQTTITLPCRAQCGDLLNLLAFAAHFGFTDFELECLADCNYELVVREVVLCDGYLELSVEKVE